MQYHQKLLFVVSLLALANSLHSSHHAVPKIPKYQLGAGTSLAYSDSYDERRSATHALKTASDNLTASIEILEDPSVSGLSLSLLYAYVTRDSADGELCLIENYYTKKPRDSDFMWTGSSKSTNHSTRDLCQEIREISSAQLDENAHNRKLFGSSIIPEGTAATIASKLLVNHLIVACPSQVFVYPVQKTE